MTKLEFIYFDLGNVILMFDHDLMCRQMASVAGVDFSLVKQFLFESDFQIQYETGLITSQEFFETFCDQTNSTPEKDALLQASSDIFELNPKMIPLLTQLTAIDFPIGILSNTCEAHWDFICRRFPSIDWYFTKRVLSNQVQSVKPDGGIYQAAIELAGCPAKDIFFVDDKLANVDAAKEAGLFAVQFEDALTLTKTLVELGAKINL